MNKKQKKIQNKTKQIEFLTKQILNEKLKKEGNTAKRQMRSPGHTCSHGCMIFRDSFCVTLTL